ncbi:MAG: hypothetical protein H6742_09270 [Alphaproteobacteria bacterium]|nr:hypothetical protein [Alphaproteobacteria bacterium]
MPPVQPLLDRALLDRSLLLLCLASGCATGTAGERVPSSQAPDGFWDHWGDGQAELAGYDLVQPRYGELRHGEAVLVTVTETFDRSQRVKSDAGGRGGFPVVKLNEVRDFPTGIYDYNVMTSSFLPLDGSLPRGLPTKLSFSMQEWCGHAWDQLVFDRSGDGVRAVRDAHSYFDGEADRAGPVDLPGGALSLDAMPVLVRGLIGSLLDAGEARTVTVLPRLMDLRMQHRDLALQTGTLSRGAGTTTVDVPAGAFTVETWTLELGTDRFTWQVDVAPPHALVAWTGPDGETGVLTGLRRGRYWQEHDNGDETLRGELGLPVHLVGAP